MDQLPQTRASRPCGRYTVFQRASRAKNSARSAPPAEHSMLAARSSGACDVMARSFSSSSFAGGSRRCAEISCRGRNRSPFGVRVGDAGNPRRSSNVPRNPIFALARALWPACGRWMSTEAAPRKRKSASPPNAQGNARDFFIFGLLSCSLHFFFHVICLFLLCVFLFSFFFRVFPAG